MMSIGHSDGTGSGRDNQSVPTLNEPPRGAKNIGNPSLSRTISMAEHIDQSLNRFSIPCVFGAHFWLIFATLLADETGPHHLKPYIALYNVIFFITIMWSIHESTSASPLQVATIVDIVSIVFDIIVFRHFALLSQCLLAINILLRPITSLILLRKSFARSRRLKLHSTSSISLASAIKALLFQQQQQQQQTTGSNGATTISQQFAELYQKSQQPMPDFLSTISSPNQVMSLNRQK